MTVAVNDTIERYVIAGAGPYAYTWRIFNDTDLQVYALSLAVPPVPTLLTLTTHYTVTGANLAAGGSITLTAAAIAAFTGFTIDIRANTPENQPTSIRNQARFLPEIHEDAFDYLSRQIQDLARIVAASVRSPDNENPLAMILPPVASRAGGYLAFDVFGVPIKSAGTGTDNTLRNDLASTVSGADGARLVGYRRVGVGSVAEAVSSVLNNIIWASTFGAVGDNATNDLVAITAALTAAALAAPSGRGMVRLTPGKKYFIGAGPIVIPDGIEFDIRGTWIRTTGVAAITFGNNTVLTGHNAVIESSGGAGAALKMTSTAAPNRWDIKGWPYLFPSTLPGAPAVGSVGIDFTACYKGVIEPSIEGYETLVVGGANTGDTPQTYFVELRSPRLRCTSGLTAIRLGRGCNSTTIVNPQISGANVATKGVHVTSFGGVGAGSTILLGGYIEAFLDNAATRAVLLTDAFNFTINGTTFDSNNTTGNFAIGSTGTSTQCNFYGCGFAGGWGSSTAIMSWTSSGVYNFIGGAPTNQIMLLGLSTFTGSYANGEVRIGKITGTGQPTFAGAAAADYFGRFRNTADGQGALIENNSASLVSGRSVVSLNRVGGPGYVADFENNGTIVGGIVFCTGTPEAQITAPVSTIACRTNGGAVTSFYVKETGVGNTGWVAK